MKRAAAKKGTEIKIKYTNDKSNNKLNNKLKNKIKVEREKNKRD